ncbi:MAG: hypothetical protein ACM3ML_15225 [Micromonosporaceae bacterium]
MSPHPPSLTGAETKVWSAFRRGEETDLRHVRGSVRGNGGPGVTRRPRVRAGVIAGMLCGGPDEGKIGRLMLRGAHITGRLDLSYARIDHPVILKDCTLDKPVVLTGARLGGFMLTDCALAGIDARNAELGGNLALSRVTCEGTVDIGGAHLAHDLDMKGAQVTRGDGADQALRADHTTIEGSVYCDEEFTAAGTVSMNGARVAGTVCFDHATITSGAGCDALEADGLTVGCDFSGKRLTATGEVRLVDANIASSLELRGARLYNPGHTALRFDRAQISGSVYCDQEFSAAGEIVAIGAHVKGTAYFNDAELGLTAPATGAGQAQKNAVALRLVNMQVDGNLAFWRRFAAHGMVILTASQVAGELTLLTTNLGGSVAADLTGAHVGRLKLIGTPPGGILDLTKVTASLFEDDPATWSKSGSLALNGFEYNAIHMTGVTFEQRRAWLARGTERTRAKYGGYYPAGYLPQPYEQLAAAYHRVGDDHTAHRILLEKHKQRNRATPWRRAHSRIWNKTQELAIGYGYKPGRAIVYLVALFLLGTLAFRYLGPPVSSGNPATFTLANSFFYTLDLLLPILNLGVKQEWHLAGTGDLFLATALISSAWVLGATVVAAVTRALQRD